MTDLLRFSAAAALASVCAWGMVPHAHAGQSAGSSDPLPFSADVTVERVTVDRDGSVVRRMPKVQYRIAERPGPRGAQTEIRFHDTPPYPGRGPLQDPSAGFRVLVSPENGIQVFDPAGTPVASPPPGTVAPATAPSLPAIPAETPSAPSAGASLALPRSGTARREALVARFGVAVGRHGTRERYVRSEADTMEEMLVDPDTALPVEINTVKGGRLMHKSSLSYAALPDGRFYCSSQRDETLLHSEGDEGLRDVTTTTYRALTGGAR